MPPVPKLFCTKHQQLKVKKKPRGWICLGCRREQDKNYRRKDPRSKMLWDAKRRARQEGVPFNLRKEDLTVPIFCPILGIPIYIGNDKASDNSPSLDKRIPKLGYVLGNVAIISSRANRLKSDATVEELEKILLYSKQ